MVPGEAEGAEVFAFPPALFSVVSGVISVTPEGLGPIGVGTPVGVPVTDSVWASLMADTGAVIVANNADSRTISTVAPAPSVLHACFCTRILVVLSCSARLWRYRR